MSQFGVSADRDSASEKKKYINDQKLEIWTRGHVYLCLSASPSFPVVRLSLLENTGSSHSSSGNFLSTEWRVLLKSWLKGELTDIHLEGTEWQTHKGYGELCLNTRKRSIEVLMTLEDDNGYLGPTTTFIQFVSG